MLLRRPAPLRTESLEERLLLAAGSFVVSPVLGSIDPSDLAKAMLGADSNISIVPGSVVYRGADGQGGTYTGLSLADPVAREALLMPDGVILTSGDALAAETNSGTGEGTEHGAAGDADLSALIGGTTTNDANVLEFQFTVSADMKSIKLELLFGSEEFPEFVGQFNDVLGIFLDGQQIAFDASNKPLTVNNNFFTLNNTSPLDTLDPDAAGKTAVSFVDLEYDGLTRRLMTVAPLDPSVTVHTLKIAIADAGDDSLDSAALIANLAASTQVVGDATTDDEFTDGGELGPDTDAGIAFAVAIIQQPPILLNPNVANDGDGTPAGVGGGPANGGSFSDVAAITNTESDGSGGDKKLQEVTAQLPPLSPREQSIDAVMASFADPLNRRVAVDNELESLLTNLADAEEPRLLAVDLGDEVIQKSAATVKEVIPAAAAPLAAAVVAPTAAQPEDNSRRWSPWWFAALTPVAALVGKLAWTHRTKLLPRGRFAARRVL